MAQLDDIVGSVMKKLDDMGVEDDTIVVFTTDNGTENFTWPDGGQTPFAGGKGTVHGRRLPRCLASSAGPARFPPARSRTGSSPGSTGSRRSSPPPAIPSIVEELKQGKKLGDTTYKVHLDGYDQTDLITGKGPSKRHEIWYFAEGTLGAARIDDFKYRFIDQPNGWLGGTVKPDMPILVNLRLDPFERTGLTGSLELLPAGSSLRVLAIRLRPAGGGEAGPDGDRVPADAEGRELQPRGREGTDPEGRPDAGGEVNVSRCRRARRRRSVAAPDGRTALMR